MKALTIWQPWADAIGCGAKMFETRSWATRHRGELAIHASKHEPSCVTEHVAVSEAAQAIERAGKSSGCTHAHGAIIAVASLLECYPADAIPDVYCWRMSNKYVRLTLQPLSNEEHALGDFSAGRFAWLLWVVSSVDPVVPCKGAQGLWTVPTDVEQLVRTRARLP
ncbi:MAG: ASCH domain-containing protein [Candidatus Omnitrophica bacterium]|nr:ASCH domain-containing protein [Candidatus Omnitrophota bacterium]